MEIRSQRIFLTRLTQVLKEIIYSDCIKRAIQTKNTFMYICLYFLNSLKKEGNATQLYI